MARHVVGVIGGSGIYDLPGLGELESVEVDTPFGPPSGPLLVGTLGDTKMVFLARHGQKHQILPHEINYRANIYAMKTQGVDWLVSLSAVGSMREEIRPGDVVVIDQFIDRTQGRVSTFFGNGLTAHVSMADPVSPTLRRAILEAAVERAESRGKDERVHDSGTYIVINGPQFSSRAESELYRSWGVDVIGMTNMPEAKLAREAEISFATLALSTDYDCWHEEEEAVTVEVVIATLKKNAELAREIVALVPSKLPEKHDCVASRALKGAFMTAREDVPEKTLKDLSPIVGKYLPSAT